jgi:ubiquinone/menaquinone biosynthesis C-methylase UbiE
LTPKGFILSPGSPYKDILAFVEETAYFVKAAANADSTFKDNLCYDKLSDGKISKDYQPKVSDNLSITLIDQIRKSGLADGDTLLDIGCGNGNFLRSLFKAMPSVLFSGVDVNLFAIERGKKENIALGLADRIKMIVGDIEEDLGDFKDGSYDWVTALNVLHFVPEGKRDALVENLARIARKGVIFNTVQTDSSMICTAGDPLLHLLWNDFAGFYTKSGAAAFFRELPSKFGGFDIQVLSILQGNSTLATMRKK